MPNIQFSHATGFPAETYRYFFECLQGINDAPINISFVNKFGHGTYKVGRNWTELQAELIADIKAKHTTPMIGMGHSMGGLLTLIVAIKQPELFEKIIILDPPFFGWRSKFWQIVGDVFGLSGRFPPASLVRNRRNHFDSLEQAYEHFRPKRLFKNFHPNCFKDYIDLGLQAASQTKGYTLSFDPEIEYNLFRTTPYFIPNLPLKVPTHLVYATSYEVLKPRDITYLQRTLPNAQLIPFQGGHLFPFEQPHESANLITSLLYP